MDNVETFRRQIEAMYGRLGQLYDSIDHSTPVSPDIAASTWKELGVAAEELQVANEELQQQTEQIATHLEAAATERYHYQHLLKNVPVAHLITTPEGKIQEASQMAATLLRTPHSMLLGKLLISFVIPEYRTAFRTQLIRLPEETQLRNWSAWFQPREAAPVHLLLTASAAYSPIDQQLYFHWVLQETNDSWATIAPLQLQLDRQPSENGASEDGVSKNGASKNGASEDGVSKNGVSENGTLFAQERPIVTFEKGQSIPLCPQTLWLVQQGLVKLYTLTEENEEVLLGLLSPSMPFGMGSPFLPVYQACALSDVKLVQFSFAELKASPQLAQMMLSKLHQRFEQLECLLTIAGQRRVRNRLHWLLGLLQEEIGEPVSNGIRLSIRLTHADLANACCTTRVTITRLLGELQRQKKIAIDGKFHIVLKETFKA